MHYEPTHLDLFSGIGGFTIAAQEAGFRTVGFSEIEPFCCRLLKYRFPNTPNLGSVKQLKYGYVDLLTGGVPCQPASTAGAMLGSGDERWLWPETIRILGETRPGFAVFENPPGLLILDRGREFERIICQIAALGYDIWWEPIPACAVGSPHERFRILIVAISHSIRRNRFTSEREGIQRGIKARNKVDTSIEAGATSDPKRFSRRKGLSDSPIQRERNRAWESERAFADFNGGWDLSSPNLCGVDNGIPQRVDRTRALGNAIVPQVAFQILKPIHDLIVDSMSDSA